MKEIIFIVGPTATGKSETACHLARGLAAEIISSDSMLVYKEVSVITARPDNKILKEVPHHFVGTISVQDAYNVFDYYTAARTVIRSLFAKHIPVIVCGGSGLYVKALCDGIFEGTSNDLTLRNELSERAEKEGIDGLYRELCAVDPKAALKIAPQDKRRVIRALEVYHASGEPISKKQRQARGLSREYHCRMFGLRLRRPKLYECINARCARMFEKGAIDEVRRLRELRLSKTASKIIGIKEINAFLDGILSREEALSLMQKNTRNFAKRQMTWFNKDTRIEWIDIDNMTPQEISKEITKRISEHRNMVEIK